MSIDWAITASAIQTPDPNLGWNLHLHTMGADASAWRASTALAHIAAGQCQT